MRFASGGETCAAALVMTRWLPELVRRVESGVKAMGIVIEKKVIAHHADGSADPVLLLRGRRGWELELRLRNALEDFLTLDRDERPARFDPRLFDKEYAERKLGEVVESRLVMVRAINESKRAGEVAKRVEKLTPGHGTFRIWEYDVCDLAGEDDSGGQGRR